MMGVLDGFTIVELATGLAGPYAGQLLGSYGAAVVKVERPGSGDFARTWGPFVDGESLYFTVVNRGKKSIAVDLRLPQGREIALRLIDHADALIENFRPGTLESWSLGPDVLLERNPDLILCRISGFGQTGPYRSLPAFDPVIQALSGFMSANGHADSDPVRSPLPISDVLTGIHGALTVAAALHEPKPRRHNVIDLALLDVMLSDLFPLNLVHLGTGAPIERMGNRHPSLSPYEVFDAADGQVCVAVANEGQWHRFCAAADLLALRDDDRFRLNADRLRNRDALRAVLDDVFPRRTTAEWITVLREREVPCAPINTVAEAVADPHVRERNLVSSVKLSGSGRTITLPNLTPRNWHASSADELPSPPLGAHTEPTLRWLGFADQEVQDMEEHGVVEQA